MKIIGTIPAFWGVGVGSAVHGQKNWNSSNRSTQEVGTQLPEWKRSGGGFFLACKVLGKDLTIHSPSGLFIKVEISSHTPIPLFFFFYHDRSTVAQRAERTVAKCFLTSCV